MTDGFAMVSQLAAISTLTFKAVFLNMVFVPREMFRTDIGPRKWWRYRDKSDSKHNPNNGASNRSGPESLSKVGGRKRHVCRLLYSQAQGRPDGWHHLS
jgi:hypothetical protein